jgi:hypothetical protein
MAGLVESACPGVGPSCPQRRREEPEPDLRMLTVWWHELFGDDLKVILIGQPALRVRAAGRLKLTDRS